MRELWGTERELRTLLPAVRLSLSGPMLSFSTFSLPRKTSFFSGTSSGYQLIYRSDQQALVGLTVAVALNAAKETSLSARRGAGLCQWLSQSCLQLDLASKEIFVMDVQVRRRREEEQVFEPSLGYTLTWAS